MTKILTRTVPALVAAFLLVAGGAAIGCRRGGDAATEAQATKPQYHCPMHPTYVSDRPGQCPICKMDLVPIAAASASPTAGAAGAAVAGRAMVALSPERRQLLGVRSEAVTRRHLDRTIRTVGRVAMDERRLHHVHTKYEAYVEKLYVNFVGQMVRKGDHLAALYAPELVATQQEYLLAFRAQQRLGQSGIASVAKGGTDLLEAARQRLLFWDVSPEDIATLERTGKVERTVDLHAELPGYVLQKSAVHGMRVTPADILFDIADLSAVWILADVYESDLATVELGMAAEVTLPYQPGRTWRGTVAFVNPTVEPGTRTVKVRIEVANEGYALKPDMFADVVLRRELGDALFVPESAVLRPGERRIVFLDLGDGTLAPREIETGARVEGGYAVLSGLAEGDKVVTSANFLIDSESSLKAALASMGAATPGPEPHAAHAPATPTAAPAQATPPKAKTTPAPKAAYVCPMHPEVTSDGPASCRICGMDLVPAAPPGPKATGHEHH
jgi:Cu(I)/Ag(I) efflux system membrane fusion protein